MKTADRAGGPLGPLERRRVARGGALSPQTHREPIHLVRHELFRERLRALDRDVERAVAESGAAVGDASWLADGLEAVLDAYAQVVRGLRAGAPLVAFAPLARWAALRRRPAVRDFGYDRRVDEAVAPLLRFLYRSWWRVEVGGLENLPASGRALVVANHSGALLPYDAAMLGVAIRDEHPAHRTARPLLDDFVHRLPLLGEVAARCGGVRARAANAERLLGRDELVIAFPEGPSAMGKAYRERYRLRRFGRGSFVRVALRTGSPIVPVAIVGAEEMHPVLARWDWMAGRLGLPCVPVTPTFPWLGFLGMVPLPSKWRIEVGAPVDWRGVYGGEAAGDRRLVTRLAGDVRQRVQRLVVRALERRGPAFF